MSQPVFKPGDLVWVKFLDNPRECPDEVIPWRNIPEDFISWCDIHEGHHFVALKNCGAACTVLLRPRRDDYQQKEGLGSIDYLSISKTLVPA